MKRFGILIIALFAFAACNNDSRYQCIADGPVSDRGCFLCRGDQCEPQPAPTRDSCLADTDCGVREICTTLGCVGQCEDAYECPLGTTCADGGLCLNPLEDHPDPPPFRCQFNFECGESRLCIDGECLLTCLDAPCPGTQQCVAGACRPCTDAVCLTSCTDDLQCADHEYCSSFQCIADTRPAQFCPENECQDGRICLRGQCRTPCETSEECARIDATIRFCAPVGSQNLCVRSSEVLAECQLNIDCGFGEECVDGACAASSTSASP
ncbi:MAG: hypothetical protein WCF10_16835 [Polyangiales bacterium]